MFSRLLINQFKNTTNKLLFKNNALISAANLHNSFPLLYAAPIKLKMPSLSPTMTEGNIVKWHKKEGDKVAPGDILLEIQTDKAVIAYEVEEEGIIAKILLPEDTKNVQVGTLLGLMVLPGDDWKSVTVPTESGAPKQAAASPSPAKEAPKVDQHPADLMKIGPAAKHLLSLYNIDVNQIKPSGPHGFILKSDVKEYIDKNKLTPKPSEPSESVTTAATAASQPAPASTAQTPNVQSQSSGDFEVDYQDIELSSMRRTIAKRLLESKTIMPHSYITANAVIDKIVGLRKELISKNQKVSINDFIIKASALALRIVPELNSNYDSKTDQYKQLNTVDVSVAVATDAGLITPIVKDADKLGVVNISEKVKELADRARQNKLKLNEFQGGSFSISNLGMFGISQFTAVINPPQVGILAVGKSQLKFTPDLKTQTEMTFCLCYDERCVSLDRAQTFLNTLNYFIANPDLLVQKGNDF